MIVITTKREVKCNHLYYVLKEENVDSRNMVVSSKTNKKSKKKKQGSLEGRSLAEYICNTALPKRHSSHFMDAFQFPTGPQEDSSDPK